MTCSTLNALSMVGFSVAVTTLLPAGCSFMFPSGDVSPFTEMNPGERTQSRALHHLQTALARRDVRPSPDPSPFASPRPRHGEAVAPRRSAPLGGGASRMLPRRGERPRIGKPAPSPQA